LHSDRGNWAYTVSARVQAAGLVMVIWVTSQ